MIIWLLFSAFFSKVYVKYDTLDFFCEYQRSSNARPAYFVIDSIVEENWLCITRNTKFKGNNFIMKLFHQVMYPNNDIMIIDDKKGGGGGKIF